VFGASKVRAIVFVVALVLCQALFCNSSDKMQRARDLLAKGSLSEAVAVLRQVVLDDPGNVDAHLTLGTALALQGLRDQSLKEIQTAIDLSPNSARARNQLGVIQSSYLETGAARKAFEDALLLDPNFAEAHLNLAMILAQTGELTLAHEHLDKAIGLYGAVQPAAKAYFLRAKVWSAQGDNDNATIDLEEATRLDSGYLDAWFDLSQLKHSKGDLQGALTGAQRVVGLNPKNAEAQSWLGRSTLKIVMRPEPSSIFKSHALSGSMTRRRCTLLSELSAPQAKWRTPTSWSKMSSRSNASILMPVKFSSRLQV
jgi:tetratricopeptide (TPR) repeat protein